MNISLQGRRALVCGSTQGIGLASAKALATLGASVTLLARNAEALAAAHRDLPHVAGAVHGTLIADFADPAFVQRAIENDLRSNPSGYHILINNTGGPPGGRIIDAQPDDYIAAFKMHLISAQILSVAVIPAMRQARYGRIINIISTSVKAPIAGLGVSNTIRGAVAQWAKTLATELGPDSITVNNILPGFTQTERLTSLLKTRAQKQGSTEELLAQEFRNSIPLGRFGTADEIANAVAFLASPAASYISGINLPVDGGRTPSL